MKIRIKGNSIRLRLTKTEVANFGLHGYLEETTQVGPNTFIYALANDASVSSLSAKMEGAKITMQVPAAMAKQWTETDEVGLQNIMKWGNDQELFLLLEKDFVCIDNTFEDQSDNYPNPNGAC